MNILEYPEFLEQAIKISQTRFLKVKTWIPNLADIQIYWEAPLNTFENFYGFHFFLLRHGSTKNGPHLRYIVIKTIFRARGLINQVIPV